MERGSGLQAFEESPFSPVFLELICYTEIGGSLPLTCTPLPSEVFYFRRRFLNTPYSWAIYGDASFRVAAAEALPCVPPLGPTFRRVERSSHGPYLICDVPRCDESFLKADAA